MKWFFISIFVRFCIVLELGWEGEDGEGELSRFLKVSGIDIFCECRFKLFLFIVDFLYLGDFIRNWVILNFIFLVVKGKFFESCGLIEVWLEINLVFFLICVKVVDIFWEDCFIVLVLIDKVWEFIRFFSDIKFMLDGELVVIDVGNFLEECWVVIFF